MIKVLVATKISQGVRKNDFCFCEENELLYSGMECDKESVDGGCGCKRSMAGIRGLKATTTMKVIELEKSVNWYKNQIKKSLEKGGWLSLMTIKEAENNISETVTMLLDLAKKLKVGAVYERRGNSINERIIQ